MNQEDLLYTNRFTTTESLPRQQIQRDANNYIPYRTLKSEQVNQVKDDLERTMFRDNPLTSRQLKAYGWNKGVLANERPVLSDFARDISESSYFRYRTNYVNIDSRFRDIQLYPFPNNYSMFLGKKYSNIEMIKLVDYFMPETEYPINRRNNVFMWFTVPFEMINFYSVTLPPFFFPTGTLNICSWFLTFEGLINNSLDCFDTIAEFRNNIYKCLFAVEVPPGNYTTSELEATLEELISTTTYFNSSFLTMDEFKFKPGFTETKNFYKRAQLAKVRINPENSSVDITMRYEEIKIVKMKSFNGKNYFDIELYSIDPLVPSEEWIQITLNEVYPLIPTGIPKFGGMGQVNMNNIEYITKNQFEQYLAVGFRKSYYDVVRNPETNEPVPNILRLYIYDVFFKEVLFSGTEIISGVKDVYIGREALFFLINSTNSPLFEALKLVNNNGGLLTPFCALECDLGDDQKCVILPPEDINKINSYLCNVDGSSRVVSNLLGYNDTNNNTSIVLVGPYFYGRAIQPNIMYVFNYTSSVVGLDQLVFNFLKCESKLNPEYFVQIDYFNPKNVQFRLPICKNPDGTFSFVLNNYIFLKILNPQLVNFQSSSITQVQSASTYANGTNDLYDYQGNAIKGFFVQAYTSNINPEPVLQTPECDSVNLNTDNTTQVLVKNINNLFAKIKFSPNSGSCLVEDKFVNELVYYDSNVVSLDQFVVQFVDYEGKLLELKENHNFTLMVVEKMEVLKETNISSRTGFVNSVGTVNVERNNFSM